MFKIAICDDTTAYIGKLKDFLIAAGCVDAYIYEYASGKEFLAKLDIPYDIVILDIQLGDMNGNHVAQKFRKVNRDAVLVLCSGVKAPVPLSFVVEAYRYLVKGDSDEKIIRTLQEVLKEAENRSSIGDLMAKDGEALVSVKISSIMYISKLKNGSELHVVAEAQPLSWGSVTVKQHVSRLYERLREQDFEYAHGSYIVNFSWVREIGKDFILLKNGEKLALSRSRYKTFVSRLTNSLARKY